LNVDRFGQGDGPILQAWTRFTGRERRQVEDAKDAKDAKDTKDMEDMEDAKDLLVLKWLEDSVVFAGGGRTCGQGTQVSAVAPSVRTAWPCCRR
jgi:hypothetical protein